MIVVCILAVMAGAIAPIVGTRTNISLPAAARVVAGNLRYVRALAVERNASFQVDFDLSKQMFAFYRTDGVPLTTADVPGLPGELVSGRWQTEMSDVVPGRDGTDLRLLAVVQHESATPVTSITIHSHGGMSPDLNEDVVIWLAQGRGTETRYVSLRWAWITGIVEADGPFDELKY